MKLTRTGSEERLAAIRAVKPTAFSVSQSMVQLRAAFSSENCPPLWCATSIGETGWIFPPSKIRSGKYPASVAVGVGQDEQSAPAMSSARFSRREQARLWRVAQASKVPGDVGVSQGQVPFDVLAPHPFGADFVDDASDLGPEVPGVLLPCPVAGEAEGLAGIAGRDEMNSATPRSAVEGSKVVPDRRCSQGLVFHPAHESGRRMAFPLDESHSSIVGLGDVQAEIEAGISGAEGDAAEVVGFRGELGTKVHNASSIRALAWRSRSEGSQAVWN